MEEQTEDESDVELAGLSAGISHQMGMMLILKVRN